MGGELAGDYTLSTDKFVSETGTTYSISSDGLRLTGHPYHTTNTVGWVSPSRFTVFELQLPDVNKFKLPERVGRIDLKSEKYVWKLVGLRVDSQGSIKPATTAQTGVWLPSDNGCDITAPTTCFDAELQQSCADLFTEQEEGENNGENQTDLQYIRWGMEHSQRQLIVAGCKPATGVYEKFVKTGSDYHLERQTKDIQDGDICEFGYGNQSVAGSEDPSSFPVEMVANPDNAPMIPDFMGMLGDEIGDNCFFHIERNASGIKHTGHLEGTKSHDDFAKTTTPAWLAWMDKDPNGITTATAGIISHGNDIMNRNYWLNKARGANNGVLFDNKLFVTVVDNFRGQIYRWVEKASDDVKNDYDPTKNKFTVRHVKEFKVHVIVRLCKIQLESQLVNWMLQHNKEWLKNFGFDFTGSVQSKPIGIVDVHHEFYEEPEEEAEPPPSTNIKLSCDGKLRDPHSHYNHLAKEYAERVPPPTKAGPKRRVTKK
ncbi:L1 protein [Papillomaviridae sp. Seabass_c17043]|nr:L1 protein [Papillomaviridae sp. Seabass_c17043]